MKSKPVLLIADDSPSIRQVIRNAVEAWLDVDILEAEDGEEAGRIIQERNLAGLPVDVLVLDWMMPRISGIALLAKIRGTGALEVQPEVVMLTAETYPDQISACLKYRVARYLTKPFTEQEIVETLKKILIKGGYRDAV
ncbi:response regulator [bacterium]|jgi:CheY-like chemotaxis protein|nr:response regulator [bacterium]